MQKYVIFEGQGAINKITDLIAALSIDLKPFIIKAQYINHRRWDIITKENLIHISYLGQLFFVQQMYVYKLIEKK